MATNKTIKYFPEVAKEEHEDSSAPPTKRVLLYGWDSNGTQKVRLKVNADGELVTSEAAAGFSTNDLEEASATLTYVGKESMSGAWYVQEVDESSDLTVQHATVANNGAVTSYSDAWTNRAGLTYGDYNDAF